MTQTLQDVATQLATGDRVTRKEDSSKVWIPATIVVVVDKEKEDILTGSTKPISSEIEQSKPQQSAKEPASPATKVLTDMATSICRSRLGPKFYEVINQCSRRYSEKAFEKDIRGDYLINMEAVDKMEDQGIHDLYNSISRWPRCDMHSQLEQEAVYSWAYDGNTFKPKSPCIRCTYLYSSWHLGFKPDTPEKMKEDLHGLRGYQMEYHDQKNPPCGYCAETVAAAQLFALRQGQPVFLG